MDKARSQQFMAKVVSDLGTSLAVMLVHVGDRVGLFRLMAGAGPLTREALEERSGVHPRYLEEWLCAMLCAGYVEHDETADTWRLPDEHALFFADATSEYYLGGMFKGAPALAAMAPTLAAAFETGQGIAFAAYGDGTPLAIEHMNRSVYEARLVKSWLPALPTVVQRLQQGGRAIDIGCGTGVVPVLLAQAFPHAQIEGLDIDTRSIEIARENARRAGVGERVRFVVQSAADWSGSGYDFISTFDCVHDLGDPSGALRRIRAALAPAGRYLMVEPKVAPAFSERIGNPFAGLLHGLSCMACVPQSLAQGGPGLGACWGAAAAQRLATDAGFSRFDLLPIHSPVQAFYALGA
jgi:SAM-dependent methyltransferase